MPCCSHSAARPQPPAAARAAAAAPQRQRQQLYPASAAAWQGRHRACSSSSSSAYRLSSWQGVQGPEAAAAGHVSTQWRSESAVCCYASSDWQQQQEQPQQLPPTPPPPTPPKPPPQQPPNAAPAARAAEPSSSSSSSSSSVSGGTLGGSSSSLSGSKGLLRTVRPALDPLAAQQAVQRRLAQQQQQDVAGGPHQQQQQQSKPQHLLAWRGQRSLLPPEQQQQQQQQEQQQEQQPLVVQQEQAAVQDLTTQQQQQQLREQQQYLTSPVSFVAAQTHPRRLAGSLAACFALHSHQLLFASGPLALANALKGLATVRGMVTQHPAAAGAAAGPAAAGSDAEPAFNILVQPTIRSRAAAGRSAYALDIAKVGPLPLPAAGTTRAKGPGAANAAVLHLTSSSNEHTAARNLVENMPRRGQTVLRVAGPYAVETAVLAVALARPMMVAAWGQDLALLVMWSTNKAYNGSKTGLLLSVFRCAVGVFPPQVQTEPPSGPIEEQAELWQRARNRSRQQMLKRSQRKQQQQQQQQQQLEEGSGELGQPA